MGDEIGLWWIGEGAMEERVMEEVRAQVERVFARPTRLVRDPARPTDTLDPRRGQHSSTQIVRWLLETGPAHAGPVIAVTDRDLFIPVLTFVFGEAKLGGGVAVVSAARLGGDGRAPASPRLVAARLGKECVHELGHAFGLVHCADPRCAMARSATLIHVDGKSGALCRDCRIRLRDTPQHEGGGAHGQ